jgi:hypothetical protein
MKTNVALCFVAAMLAVFAYFDWRAEQGGRERSPVNSTATAREPVFSLDRAGISAIDFRDERGCVLARATAGSDRSASDLAALTDLLVETTAIRRFPPSVDWRAYGLDRPRMRIEVSQDGTGQFQELEIGATDPTGTSVYARRDQRAEVMVVGRYLLEKLDMALQSLQERSGETPRSCAPESVQQGVS